MLTIIAALLAGIFLAYIFASALKAVIVVGLFLLIIQLGNGVTFEALVDHGARARYDSAGYTGGVAKRRVQPRPAPQFYDSRERI